MTEVEISEPEVELIRRVVPFELGEVAPTAVWTSTSITTRLEGAEHGSVAIKFITDMRLYDNEVAALGELAGVTGVPSLLAHEQVPAGTVVLGGRYHGWLCRSYAEGAPLGFIEDELELALLQEKIGQFLSDCKSRGVSVGDPKLSNFIWNRPQQVLTWIDFGWFRVDGGKYNDSLLPQFLSLLRRRPGSDH